MLTKAQVEFAKEKFNSTNNLHYKNEKYFKIISRIDRIKSNFFIVITIILLSMQLLISISCSETKSDKSQNISKVTSFDGLHKDVIYIASAKSSKKNKFSGKEERITVIENTPVDIVGIIETLKEFEKTVYDYDETKMTNVLSNKSKSE